MILIYIFIMQKIDVKLELQNTVDMTIVDKVFDIIAFNTDKRIVLLRNKEVLQWLFGDLSFLPPIETKNVSADEAKHKLLEDTWGCYM